ncbi:MULTISPECIES: reverse transcriptase domain-containing protein [Chryseobacterium]|uniref:RNA-directed DNA polymerase n=1 Tax=Chryseobacterium geocarposphaerae TaxID=1416776 RepID=A0ABU1LHC6_9FLAO|nr:MULTISPECIES: reverse transcriptase domain-containing protein [Chryseobacterium]MDR6406120.1 retron-type reverse transcriptase [Chryseobacterium geocarposphaerae]MDR6699406.1 retron-type reverse transcriptase [Chryseobacterium ginsenosidimutans]
MTFNQEEFTKVTRLRNHSDEFLDVTIQYANNLLAKKLPVIFSLKHFSILINMEFEELVRIIDTRNYLYKFYQIKKKNNKGFRQIVVPYSNIRYVQNYIKTEILDKVPVSEYATGFVKGKSIYNNAKVHVNQQEIMNVDLFKFFDSITEKRVYAVFRSLGYAKNLAWDFAKLTTVKLPEAYLNTFKYDELKLYSEIVNINECVLPQGAPTSPILSNLVTRRLDKRLSSLATKLGVNYSRYADDITFSGNYDQVPNFNLISKIIDDEGFRINWRKAKISKKGRLQLVTGLTVSNDIHIHRKFKKEVKKHIYGCLNFGVENHLNHIEKNDLGFYKEWLLGKIYFIYSIEPKYAKKLLEDYNKIIWLI